MYYLSIGYPLGAEIIDNRQMYQVSLKSRTISLLPIEYRIWSRFLLGAYERDVENTLSEQDRMGFAPTINKLLQYGLLFAFAENDFTEIRRLKFLRQGIGAGIDFQKNAYGVMFREKILLTEFEYSVWKEADGVISFGEIERRIVLKYQCPIYEIQRTVIGLVRRGLLLAVNREEG